MGIDDESSHPELCSEVADGVTRFLIYPGGVGLFREPDAGNLPVRFDEREQETGSSQTGLRRAFGQWDPKIKSHPECFNCVIEQQSPPAIWPPGQQGVVGRNEPL